MRSTGKNRAAATAGKNTRQMRGRQGATMNASPMRRRGNSKRGLSRCFIKNRSRSSMSSRPKEATSREATFMDFTLKVWRQPDRNDRGQFRVYKAEGITPDMSFLEMLDSVTAGLAKKGEDTIAFDHDCREGICGSCGMYINGRAHGPERGVATCQLYMRSFKDGSSIVIEPGRAK